MRSTVVFGRLEQFHLEPELDVGRAVPRPYPARPFFEKRTGLHLPHRPAAVHLHRGFGDADIVGNLFAQAAARHLNYDLALPGA